MHSLNRAQIGLSNEFDVPLSTTSLKSVPKHLRRMLHRLSLAPLPLFDLARDIPLPSRARDRVTRILILMNDQELEQDALFGHKLAIYIGKLCDWRCLLPLCSACPVMSQKKRYRRHGENFRGFHPRAQRTPQMSPVASSVQLRTMGTKHFL